MKILAAVDGSSYTKRMLAYLAAHDDWLGTQHAYTVTHAIAPVPSRAAAVVDKAALAAYYHDEAEKVFRPIRSFFTKQGLKATFDSRVGLPADVVTTLAKKGRFDLIVMGSHGHGSLASLVMGSVAIKVLAQTSVPVLLIR